MALPTDQQTVSSLGGTTQAQQPTITTALPTKNAYGNDMTLANRMNAGADQMRASREGSGGGLSRPSAPSYDPFSRPGDGNGDSQKRQQEYEGLLRSAASQTGRGASKRAAAMTTAAQGLLAPGLSQMQQQGQDYQSQLSAYDQAMQGGYGGSAPPTGGDPSALINGLAQIFGPQEAAANPTAPADPNAPALPSSYARAADYSGATQSTPAIPAPATTVTDPTTPDDASALPNRAQSAGLSALEMIKQQQIDHAEKQAQEAKEWERIRQESSDNFRNIGAKNSSIRRLDLSDLVGGGLS
jgi:hypothetical protein